MSHSSAAGGGTWAEPEAGPSNNDHPLQGYCGYCRLLYSDLAQHLSSLHHLDAVRSSSIATADASTSTVCVRSKLTLLERFLQDVEQHYPHRYQDTRSSHADLPSGSNPSSQQANRDERHVHDEGRRERPSSSDDDLSICNQWEEERLDRGQEALPPQILAPPLIHRKAHRKTDRRKTSRTPSPPLWREEESKKEEGAEPTEQQQEGAEPEDKPGFSPSLVQQVIQSCCHGDGPEETDSFHFSLPVVSMETPTQVVPRAPPTDSPVPGRSLCQLTDRQVILENRAYARRLDGALKGRAERDGWFWTLPVENVLPAAPFLPESFRGKTWAQVEQEDEERVERLVRQFRQGRFRCYFDSESLARLGQHCRRVSTGGRERTECELLPLVEREEEEGAEPVRRTGRGRDRKRNIRVASRCQVVKVSHSTQTVRLVVPAVAPEAPPTTVPAANQNAAERTPETKTWRRLPPSYSALVSPVQPHTSLIYLLCSPFGPAHTAPSSAPSPAAASPSKRCRKRRRPPDLQGLKVKYRRSPLRFYEPGSNRVLRAVPKGALWRPSPAPSSTTPPHVRQLFRSLSPDLNTGWPAEGATEAKRQRLAPSGGADDDIRGRGQTAQAPLIQDVSPRGRSARRARPPSSKRRTRTQATPPPPRREGLRRNCSASLAPSAGRRGRRGRGSKRERR